jgi:hypothetical protein
VLADSLCLAVPAIAKFADNLCCGLPTHVLTHEARKGGHVCSR